MHLDRQWRTQQWKTIQAPEGLGAADRVCLSRGTLIGAVARLSRRARLGYLWSDLEPSLTVGLLPRSTSIGVIAKSECAQMFEEEYAKHDGNDQAKHGPRQVAE